MNKIQALFFTGLLSICGLQIAAQQHLCGFDHYFEQEQLSTPGFTEMMDYQDLLIHNHMNFMKQGSKMKLDN